MKLRIYVAYHKTAPVFSGKAVVPIQVGAALNAAIPGLTRDDTGDHISEKNETYCELTALYWAWKQERQAEFVGVMHYRRLLASGPLSEALGQAPAELFPSRFAADEWVRDVEGLMCETSADLVLPPLHQMGRSVSENYAHAHDIADFDRARLVIAADWPAYVDSFDRVARARNLRLGNIGILRRELFNRYCVWLFDILGKVEDLRHGAPGLCQPRWAGYLAERLFTVFVAHLQETDPAVRIVERPILNLSRALVTPFSTIQSYTEGDPVNLAFACDQQYLPHAAAMVQSVLDHRAPDRRLNLFWLHENINDARRQLLSDMVAGHPGVQIIEINTAHAFADAAASPTRAPGYSTYNRFLLFTLFPALGRILYLDSDLIVRRDVAELFDSDLGGAEVGAVQDWIMTRGLCGRIRTADPAVQDLYAYQREVLGLCPDQIAGYVNAGVLLFDMAAMKDPVGVGHTLQHRARTAGFLFRDQDILNATFAGRIAHLDPRWNVFNSPQVSYDRVPLSLRQRALAARRDPWIIHYADSAYKPWKTMAVPQAQYYWEMLLRTPFYHEVLLRSQTALKRSSGWRVRPGLHRLARRLADISPSLAAVLRAGYNGLRRTWPRRQSIARPRPSHPGTVSGS